MDSMTGMGRSRGRAGNSYLTVEIKSVNHKFCEVNIRVPPRFQIFELPISQIVKKKITRGKIDIWIGEERVDMAADLNSKALKDYYRFLKQIKNTLGLSDPITLSHIQSGSNLWMTRENDPKKFWPTLKRLLDRALGDLQKMRAKEGAVLKKQILDRLTILMKIHSMIEAQKGIVVTQYKAKLEKRVAKMLVGVEVDPSKLTSEVAFFADRCEVTEELERLQSHFVQMKKILSNSKPSGRPLDFLIQEMNREWNTIASKSQDVSIAHCVVEAKSELEKIREQVQNIE